MVFCLLLQVLSVRDASFIPEGYVERRSSLFKLNVVIFLPSVATKSAAAQPDCLVRRSRILSDKHEAYSSPTAYVYRIPSLVPQP